MIVVVCSRLHKIHIKYAYHQYLIDNCRLNNAKYSAICLYIYFFIHRLRLIPYQPAKHLHPTTQNLNHLYNTFPRVSAS